jgi:glutamyl-Q tRNA(Asp) synthetase
METAGAGLDHLKRDAIGRFAPSPTGPLHFGSLVAALGSFLNVKASAGQWLVRIEDIDPPREPPQAAAQILHALEAFGLHADAPVLWQNSRIDAYRAVLQELIQSGNAFPCFCTRSQLAGLPHRGRCASKSRSQPSWRLLVPDIEISFDDEICGTYQQNLARDVGDFVLWRSDDLPSYQLACVVDDAYSGITEIIRGADLLDATPRQIYLQQLLGYATPNYAHLPLVLGPDGQKLSKQNLAPALDEQHALTLLRQAHAFLGQSESQSAKVLPDPATWLKHACASWQMDRVRSNQLLHCDIPV